jgi:hypothetical protein
MLILPKTTAAIYGYLLREGVVLNLPDEIAERLIQSGHAVAYVEPAPAPETPTNPVRTPFKRAKKEA